MTTSTVTAGRKGDPQHYDEGKTTPTSETKLKCKTCKNVFVCFGSFFIFLACNVNVAVLGVTFLRQKTNLLGRKRSGEARAGQKIFLTFGG